MSDKNYLVNSPKMTYDARYAIGVMTKKFHFSKVADTIDLLITIFDKLSEHRNFESPDDILIFVNFTLFERGDLIAENTALKMKLEKMTKQLEKMLE